MPTELADGLGLRDVLLLFPRSQNEMKLEDLPQEMVPPFQILLAKRTFFEAETKLG